MTATLEPVTVPGRAVVKPAMRQRIPVMPVRMADLAAVGAFAGAIALTDLPSPPRAIALAVFIAVAPGAAVSTWVRIPRRALPAAVPVLGMAIVTLISIAAMW